MSFNPETVHQALQEKFKQRAGERAAQAKELSTRVGNLMRVVVGEGNDVLSIPTDYLQNLFPEPRDYNEALRLQDIARRNND